MKVSDYIASFLCEQNIDKVFGVTGGGVVHLFDSIDKYDNIDPVYVHHEQTASLSAQAYSRIKGMGACIVTTGPGGTNAITGLLSSWQDSIPCIFISGQARTYHLSKDTKVRQVGIQEFNITGLVNDITNYSITVDDASKIKYYMQKAIYLATSNRPGPIWIDIPLNIQIEDVDINNLEGFEIPGDIQYNISQYTNELSDFICNSKKPLVLCGNGVHIAKAENEFEQFILKYNLPLVTTWNTSDILENSNPLYCGRIGVAGQRGANLAVHNCDLLFVIGSHLSMPLTTSHYSKFAPNAKIIMVDIDKNELEFETVKVNLAIQADAKQFLQFMNSIDITLQNYDNWLSYIEKYRKNNDVIKLAYDDYCNPYTLLDCLSNNILNENIVIDGGGTALYMPFQSMKIKNKQRMIVSSAISAMGTGLPDSIGAYFANGKKTICVIGDGSMQFNIQELQTIYHHNLPIKIIIFNNDGYLAIRHTQKDWLEKSYTGSSKQGGISIPEYEKVVNAYGIGYIKLENSEKLDETLKLFLTDDKPTVLEVMIPFDQELIPRVGFTKDENGVSVWKSLGDMAPFLSEEELIELDTKEVN